MANPSIQLGTNSNWAIKEDKLLAYKEYNDYFFNKEFDFSRGTSATYVAKDGLIKTAGIQPNIVQNGDFSELGSELITNGDFSDGSSSWVAEGGSSTWIIDDVANKFSSTNFALYQNITRTVGKIYKISFDIVEYTSGSLSFSLGNGSNTGFNTAGSKTIYKEWDGSDERVIFRGSFIGKIDNVSVKEVDPNDYWILGTDWSFGDSRAVFDTTSNSSLVGNLNISSGKLYRVKIEGEVTSGNIKLSATSGLGNDQVIALPFQQDIIHDGGANTIEIRTVGSSEGFITNITVQEIQTDTPRIDFTNDTKGHLLLEPSRTNLIDYSEDFSQWAKIHSPVVTDNFITSPDGTQNAAKVVFSGVNGCRIERVSPHSSTSVTQSIYLKTESGTQTVSIGAIGNNLKEVTVTNEWQRFEHTSTGTYPRVLCDDAVTIYVWGAQLEDGDYATSYIVSNSGSTTTRSADVANNSGNADLFNDSEGVLYAEIAALANDSTNRYITISDGTDSNRIILRFSTANRIRADINVSNSNQFNSELNINSNQFYKAAFSYKQNEFKFYVDGVLIGSSSSGSVPSSGTFNVLKLENATGGTNFYGDVKCVAVFKEALSNDLLERLTGEGYESFRLLAEANNYTII